MLALGIIILILILILILPVGADAAYTENVFSLAIKAGPFRIGILPAKSGDEKEKKDKKEKKPRKKKDKASSEAPAEEKKKKKSKLKLSFDDIIGIVRIGLKTLGRFWLSISVDKLKLHLVIAGPDPYDAVMNYGYINAALGALMPLLHRVFKIKDEDYATDIDFQSEKMKIDARIVLTVRIGEILLVVFCTAFAFIKWFLQLRRKNKARAEGNKTNPENEKKSENSSAQKGN